MGELTPIPKAFLNAFPNGIERPDRAEFTGILDQVKLLSSGSPEKFKPSEKIWKATIPVGSANVLVDFLDQNADSILNDFGTHGIDIDGERLGLVQSKLHKFTDRKDALTEGNFRAHLSDLRVLREVKSHLPHMGVAVEVQEEYEKNYWKVINPFGKVVREAKKSSNPKRK